MLEIQEHVHALDGLDDALDQGAKAAVRARNYRTGFSPLDRPADEQAGSEILIPDEGLTFGGQDRPSRARDARVVLGTQQPPDFTPPQLANDDDASQPGRVKRSYIQRKQPRADLRRRTTTLAISGAAYEQTRRAYGSAWVLGHDLDAMVTLRPRHIDDLSPEDREAFFKAAVNKVRTMYADNDDLPEFACVWSRESKRIGPATKPEGQGEHLHLLLASGGRLDLLDRYFRKHLSGREVDVRPADDELFQLRNGQVGDAATYILKGVEPIYWREYPKTPNRPSGPIYGQRVGFSKNLLDERPIGRQARPRRVTA